MRKQLQTLLGAALVATVLPSAALAAENVKLEPGSTLEIPESMSGTEYNFSFDATENGLVNISGISLSSYQTVAVSDGTTVKVASNYSPAYTMFYVEGGKTYTVNYTFYGYSLPAVVECSFTAQAQITAPTCSEPFELKVGESLLVPTTGEYDDTTWETVYEYQYVEFTAPFSGKLELCCSSSASIEYAASCDGAWTKLPSEYKYGGGYPYSNIYSMLLEEGETLIFKVGYSDYCMLMPLFREVVAGATCDDAFAAAEGENVIPAEAGTYWYKWFTPAEAPDGSSDVLMTVTSNSEATGYLSGSCNANYPIVVTPIDTRSTEYTSQTKVLKIEKTVSTAAEESFTVTFSNLEPIDNRNVGQPVEEGETVSIPKYEGSYYFAVTAPDEPALLKFKANIPASWGTSGNFTCSPLGGYGNLGSGKEFNAPMEPGKKYLITANDVPGNDGTATFTVTFGELEQGAAATFPLDAVVGDNEMPAFGSVYFKFIPDEDAYYLIQTPAEGAKLEIKALLTPDASYESSVYPTETADGWKLEATADVVYKLNFSNIEEASTVTITKLGFAEGESWTTAFVPESEEITLPQGPTKVWYKMMAPLDGFFNLSTTIPYNYSNEVIAYFGEVVANQGVKLSYQYGSDGYVWTPMKKAVEAGTEIYVCVILTDAASAGTLVYNFAELQPGEASYKPLVIDYVADEDNGMYYLLNTAASYQTPYWYEITLPEGILSITGKSFSMSVYAADDLSNELVYSQWSSEGDAIKNFIVPANNSTYMLKVISASDPMIRIQVLPGEEGTVPSQAIQIPIDSKNVEFPFEQDYDDLVWFKMYLCPGDLNITAEEYMFAKFYDGANLNVPVATSVNVPVGDSWGYGFNNLQIETEGWYYLSITRTYGDTLNIYGTSLDNTVGVALVKGEMGVTVMKGMVVNNSSADVKVFDLNGRCVANVAAGTKASVAKGLYIVTDGKKALKAVVK